MQHPPIMRLSPPRRRRRAAITVAPRAFALIAVLAILALILILVMSVSSVLHVETRTSASGKNLLLARQNALLGLDTAIAQLQEYAGKDQAVTFPATTFYPTKNLNLPGAVYPAQGKGDIFDNPTYGFRRFAQTSSARSYLTRVETYLTPNERTAWDAALRDYWNNGGAPRNARWTGIMDAALRVDRATNPNAAPASLPAQPFETLGENTKFGEPKRDQLPAWLVSGNERFAITGNMTAYPADYQTPDTPLPDPSGNQTIVWLVGNGTAASSASLSTDGIEPRVKARKIPVRTASSGNATGHYAYWVGDESVKANFSVRDPYFEASPGSVNYRNRLQSPQRVGWENISADGTSNSTLASISSFNVNDSNLENIATSKEIGLIEAAASSGDENKTAAVRDAAKNNFHSLTAWSRSLLTDTALGGLKRDLTAFLESGTGLSESDPILDRNRYDPDDPRFRAWGGTNGGFPNTPSNDGLPLWRTLRDWYRNTAAGGSITPDENTAPILTYLMLHAGLSYDPVTKRLNWHWLPAVVLWNPYDVTLEAGLYDLEVQVAPNMWRFYLAKSNPSLSELQRDAGAEWGERAVGPLIDPGDPSKGRQTVWSFKATSVNPDTGNNFWPIIKSDNPKYSFSNGTTADHYDVGGKGPFVYDDNFADGTTDGFGRFYYNLRAVTRLSGKMRDPYRSSGTRTGNATNSSYSSLGANGQAGANEFGLRWNPHKASGDGNNRLPADTFMRLRISAAFAPGESKIFTCQNGAMPEWDPTSSTPIPLAPGIDVVEPSSIWFPVAEVINGPDSAEGLRFFTEFLEASNRLIPAVRLSIGGRIIMENSAWGGSAATSQHLISTAYRDVANFGDSSGASMDGDGITNQNESAPKFMDRWRRVYAFSGSASDEFQTRLSQFSLSDTGLADVPIWPYGEHYLTPVTAQGNALKSDLHSNIPAFSRFNLGAKSTELHPLLDRIRDPNGVNNRNFSNLAEGLGKLQFINSSPRYDTPRWDNSQFTGDNGFSLIAYRTNATYRALTNLPVRLGRRPDSNLLSIGQLQQVNLSPYIWQPSFPIGNSWAGVYNDREAVAGIHSRAPGISTSVPTSVRPVQRIANTMGFTFNATSTETVNVVPNSMLDLSYLLNENLWDRYFLSAQRAGHDPATPLPNSRLRFTQDALAASAAERSSFDTAAAHIENVGALNVNSTSVEAWKALLTAFRDLSLGNNPSQTVPISRTLDPITGAIRLAFNSSGADINGAQVGATSSNKDYSQLLSGFRYLTDEMIRVLAERIVDEVRLRGPFLSLSDFVNRRLVAPQGSNQQGSAWFSARTSGWATGNPPFPADSTTTDSLGRKVNLFLDFMEPSYDPFIGLHGISGAIQRAIDVSGINGGVNHPSLGSAGTGAGYPNDSAFSLRIRNRGGTVQDPSRANNTLPEFTSDGIGKATNTQTPMHVIEPTLRAHFDTEHFAGAAAGEAGHYFQGVPGFVTQGDILAMIGPALTPRGDTFLVRTYGDAVDKNGRVLARAYVEAVVQRVPEPVRPKGSSGIDKWTPTSRFGRKFKVVSLRWLNPEEV